MTQYDSTTQQKVIETLAEFGSEAVAYQCKKIVDGSYKIADAKTAGHGSFFQYVLDCKWDSAMSKADYENKKCLQRVFDNNIKEN